jgi:hypothetical protein
VILSVIDTSDNRGQQRTQDREDKQSKNMTQKSTLYLDEQLGFQQKAVNQGAREE